LSDPTDQLGFLPDQLTILRGIVKDQLGITIGQDKNYLLISKFSKMINNLGLAQVTDLIDYLRGGSSKAQNLLARFLTTNHTFFFREPRHLEVLTSSVLQSSEWPVRVWCAASSTGEEVYSIAIALLEKGVADFIVIGSDINLEVLKACRRGVYRPDRMQGLTESMIDKYFIPTTASDGLVSHMVKPLLAERVVFKRLNLLEAFRFEQPLKYIFCRNVLIYFDHGTQQQVVHNLFNNLQVGGYLFVGHSEPLINFNLKAKSVASSVYQKTA
jgi:chemotaxis protein methyltransferase CheR